MTTLFKRYERAEVEMQALILIAKSSCIVRRPTPTWALWWCNGLSQRWSTATYPLLLHLLVQETRKQTVLRRNSNMPASACPGENCEQTRNVWLSG